MFRKLKNDKKKKTAGKESSSSIEEAKIAARKAAEEVYHLSKHYRRRQSHGGKKKNYYVSSLSSVQATQSTQSTESTHSTQSIQSRCHNNNVTFHEETKSQQDAMYQGLARAMKEVADENDTSLEQVKFKDRGQTHTRKYDHDNGVLVGTHVNTSTNENTNPNTTTNSNASRSNHTTIHDLNYKEKKRRKFGKRKKNKVKKEKDYSTFYSNDPSVVISKSKKVIKNSSICSFCGSFFSTQAYASHHEHYCIRNGIQQDQMQGQDRGTFTDISTPTPTPTPLHIPLKGMTKLSYQMKQHMIMSDDRLIKVIRHARKYVLSKEQVNAERELALLARDRSFYDMRAIRLLEIKSPPSSPSSSSSSSSPSSSPVARSQRRRRRRSILSRNNKVWHKLHNKLSDAIVLKKVDDDENNDRVVDEHTLNTPNEDIKHNDDTLYINVFVMIKGQTKHNNNSELLRSMAQLKELRFAKFSLSSDTKPEQIAVQLSNDLCRLLSPQLTLCGVDIEVDIEYREGPYFILGVNVITIDWIMIMKYFNDELWKRKNDWSHRFNKTVDVDLGVIENHEEKEAASRRFILNNLFRTTRLEILEQFLAWLYYVSWIISVPLCALLYRFFIKATMQKLIVTAVTDDIFKYVERKGMEMELEVKHARYQTAFMLDRIHKMRKDEQNLEKKKIEMNEVGGVDEVTRGPLLGPIIDLDNIRVPEIIPDGLVAPGDLEYVVFNSEIPVGFRRLRKALLFNATFLEEAVFLDALNYTEITCEPWDKYQGSIGQVIHAEGVEESNFIGAKKNTQYRMPKSIFVKANMAYEESELMAYNDYFFSVKRRTRNPDVPYGGTFCALTQITVHNTGFNSCRMICSVEAEFPNGQPMIARSIKSAMRQGASDTFLELGETICRYANVA